MPRQRRVAASKAAETSGADNALSALEATLHTALRDAVKDLAAAQPAPEPTQAGVAVRQLADAMVRHRRALEASLVDLQRAIDTALAATGAPPVRDVRVGVVPSDATYHLALPRVLTRFLELDLPAELKPVFRNKMARPRGPGYSDHVSMNGEQGAAMLDLLYRARTPSGQYQHCNKAIAELEQQIAAAKARAGAK